MHEHLWSQYNVVYCYQARHIVRGKRFYFLAEVQ